MSALLEIHDVTKRFGGLCAISHCSIDVQAGRTHGIIYRPTSGDIRFKSKRISGLRPNRVAALGIARTFQNIRLFKNLTVLENVRVAFDSQLHYSPVEAFFGFPRQARDEKRSINEGLGLLEPFALADHAESLAGELSYGSQRRLEIARALALKPSLLLLDEPAAGMNTTETATLTEFLRWVREEFRLTLVLIEHHMHLVMNLCDRITVLDFGQTIAEGTPKDIRENPRVIEAYLGEAEE
jgi:branched-chain amino acid transport system ATP-binding protein